MTSPRTNLDLAPLWVECPDCEERTAVLAATEYGTTTWEPEECKTCGRSFLGDEKWQDDEPPEPGDGDCGPSDAFDPRVDFPERYSDASLIGRYA